MENTFKLDTGDKIFLSPHITNQTIIDLIQKLSKNELEFIVLEPKTPIKNSLYIQIIYGFTIELRLVLSNDEIRHYSYETENMNEVITIFLNYFEKEEIPNLDIWKDTSDSFRPNLFSVIFSKLKSLKKKRR
ncbi:hypothetical protein P7H62_12660 [Vagococcus carniphilus]|uniref:Uncharacterized protein n=1 Tax=Vagococcus carniphilus TaxID=218144 RepID=A0AAW8U7H0_9ENTE|nr:hypothetical protein [Vagococcus carniphilus]MDT2831800.1 hypothetical protein [Vagococcus carniphilus]MDT2834120.1 hypothetical protein [Vagococcus carniphilus]MDT2840653.1 hypothetical protein [Vagococcus carniphilus]MDT2855310.1 hypothetical protein [Vagococcus carniphilus]